MTEGIAATVGAAPATADRRRLLIVGLLVAAVVVQIGVHLPIWTEAVRDGGTFGEPLGPPSVGGLAVNTVMWLLPVGVALVGLLRARPWGPAAAVGNGLLMLLPAGLSLAWLSGSVELFTVGLVAADVLQLAAAGVAATLVPWSAVTPTPARLLLWSGGGAVVAGILLPTSVGGRGVESVASSLVRFGGTSLEWGILLVGALALLAVVVLADRLPTPAGVGAAAVLAAWGVGPLSPILETWRMGEALLPIAWLGPLGTIALVMWLRAVRREVDPTTVEDPDPAVSAG